MKNISFNKYIDSLKSTEVSPGGGSANAYVAALADSLALKAIKVSAKRKSFLSLPTDVQENINHVVEVLEESVNYYYYLAEEDASIFNDYMKVYKTGDKEKILEATKECFQGPALLFDTILDDLQLILSAKDIIVKTIKSDFLMSLELIKSVINCSLFNLKINADLLDNEYQDKYEDAVKMAKKTINLIDAVISESK